MNHLEVIKRFSIQQINTRSKRVEWSGNNVFCLDNVLYSYGHHFPLAVYLGNKSPIQFITNSDKYSNSTSRHQGITRSLCHGPSLPELELKKIKINFFEIKAKNILFFREGSCQYVYKHKLSEAYYEDLVHIRYDWEKSLSVYGNPDKPEWNPPIFGKFRASKKSVTVNENDVYETGWFTVDQVVVLSWKKKFFLICKDKVSRLPRQPASIAEAVELEASQETNRLFSLLGTKAVASIGKRHV